jgi:hypothetical protein
VAHSARQEVWWTEPRLSISTGKLTIRLLLCSHTIREGWWASAFLAHRLLFNPTPTAQWPVSEPNGSPTCSACPGVTGIGLAASLSLCILSKSLLITGVEVEAGWKDTRRSRCRGARHGIRSERQNCDYFWGKLAIPFVWHKLVCGVPRKRQRG